MSFGIIYNRSGRSRLAAYLVMFSIVCLLLCGFAAAQDAPAAAEDEENSQKISWGFEADFNGKYMWRGIAFSEGAVFQPSVWVTARNTTFTVWANRELKSVDGPQLNEIDYSLTWEGQWHKASLEPSLIVYTYPDQTDAPSTAEAELKITWPLGLLDIFTTHTIDVLEYSGAYFGNVGLSYEKELSARVGMESSVSLGWASAKFNETYIGPQKTALNVASFDIALTYTAENGIYVRPHASFTKLLSGTLRDAVDDPDIFNVGLAIGMEF